MSSEALPPVTEPAMPSLAAAQSARKQLLLEALTYFAKLGVAPTADDPKLDDLLSKLDEVDPLRTSTRQEFGYLSYSNVINCGSNRAAAERGFGINQTYFGLESDGASSAAHLRTRFISEWQPVEQ